MGRSWCLACCLVLLFFVLNHGVWLAGWFCFFVSAFGVAQSWCLVWFGVCLFFCVLCLFAEGTAFSTRHASPEAQKVFAPRGDCGFSPYLNRIDGSLMATLVPDGDAKQGVGEALHQWLTALATRVFGSEEPYGYVTECCVLLCFAGSVSGIDVELAIRNLSICAFA